MAREKCGLLAVPLTALVLLTHSAREGVLNERFPNRWLGRGGSAVWPPRSPNLTPLDYYLWGAIVFLQQQNTYATIQTTLLLLLSPC